MKTALEIPDFVFKKAKAKAAEQGIPLRQFITEAVEAKLKLSTSESKPWMQVIGGLKHLKKENARIDKIIEEEFEQIEPVTLRSVWS
jgi:enolase